MARYCSNSEDKIELRDPWLVLGGGTGVRDETLVKGEKAWTVEDRKEWSPFLEEDADELVGY